MRTFWEVARFTGLILLLAFVIMIPLGLWINHMERNRCSKISKIMEIEYQYHLETGCMVKFEGKWMPLEYIGVRKFGEK